MTPMTLRVLFALLLLANVIDAAVLHTEPHHQKLVKRPFQSIECDGEQYGAIHGFNALTLLTLMQSGSTPVLNPWDSLISIRYLTKIAVTSEKDDKRDYESWDNIREAVRNIVQTCAPEVVGVGGATTVGQFNTIEVVVSAMYSSEGPSPLAGDELTEYENVLTAIEAMMDEQDLPLPVVETEYFECNSMMDHYADRRAAPAASLCSARSCSDACHCCKGFECQWNLMDVSTSRYMYGTANVLSGGKLGACSLIKDL
ncbi:MAG: hypothetical protein M1827_007698 [Pycnora praestabilis]|nr:MAG: hypothetical protein M1827_007698 [Pycnora praestabilis]